MLGTAAPRARSLGAARRYDAGAQFQVKMIAAATSATLATFRSWLSTTLIVHEATWSPSRTLPGAFDYNVKVQIPAGRTATDGEIKSDVVDALNRFPPGNVISSSIVPLYGARPIPEQELGDEGPIAPTSTAADLARSVVGDLLARGSGYDHALMQRFQRSVGISADGIYGTQTRTQLLRFVSSAPTVEAVRSSSGGGGGGTSPTLTPRPPVSPAPSSSPWIVAGIALAVLAGGAWLITR